MVKRQRTLGREELAKAIASSNHLTMARARECIDNITAIMAEAFLAGDEIKIRKFGKFSRKRRRQAAYGARNFSKQREVNGTESTVIEKAKLFWTIRFSPSATLKALVNKRLPHVG